MPPALQCLLQLIKTSIPLLKDINDLKGVVIDYFVDGTANKYGRDVTRSFGGHHNQIRLEAFIFLFDNVNHVLIILIVLDEEGKIRRYHSVLANYGSGKFMTQMEELIKESLYWR